MDKIISNFLHTDADLPIIPVGIVSNEESYNITGSIDTSLEEVS